MLMFRSHPSHYRNPATMYLVDILGQFNLSGTYCTPSTNRVVTFIQSVKASLRHWRVQHPFLHRPCSVHEASSEFWEEVVMVRKLFCLPVYAIIQRSIRKILVSSVQRTPTCRDRLHWSE
ncbi:unnamed protein product [Haemonchus placei]|uniref:Reverse transcriptase n=1 Tax=Haemonchus placei TaxID=6290 RepID=A0A0N4WS58_HAEPC|nr:unnamed protein product [Haemonchus placei]